ncbi:MAG: DoxX family protein [Saprospiraceae bacterium]|nr:DoxX family protein [Saprospiraceae bacterium]
MKKFKIAYWVATALIILIIGLGSFADLFMIDPMRESIQQQGFPVHFLPFFGVTKLLAVIVILVPALKWLKLSAYVGLFWYFAGAIYSHFAVGDPIQISVGAIIAFVSVLVSFFAWRKMEQLSFSS